MKLKKTFDFCFVISDLLSTTPRAYRAIKTLLEKGFSVCLLYNRRRINAIPYNDSQLLELSLYDFQAISTDWTKTTVKTFFHKAQHKLLRIWQKFAGSHFPFMLLGTMDYTILPQLCAGRKIKAKVFVGHRPATLPVISKLSKRCRAKTWFDIEDYHFEESTNLLENKLTSEIINKYPAQVYTNASQLIGKAFMAKLGENESVEILNSPFISDNLNSKIEIENVKPISFVWFSQSVTFGRGLETFFDALEEIQIAANVSLIGEIDQKFQAFINKKKLSNVKIKFHGFIPENKIVEEVLSADIGLAIESVTVDYSRRIAITNKILTYAIYGNFILATNTHGQIDFMNRVPNCGKLIEIENITECLLLCVENLNKLRKEKGKRILQAQSVNWQTQQKKLLSFAKNTLSE